MNELRVGDDMGDGWIVADKYALTQGPYSIGCCRVRGEWRFEVWRGTLDRHDLELLGVRESMGEAKAQAAEHADERRAA